MLQNLHCTGSFSLHLQKDTQPTTANLIIDTFAMTDCAHYGMMYPVECCNQVIYSLIRDVMHRKESMKNLELTMIRRSNHLSEYHGPLVERILLSLAPQISDLQVSATLGLVDRLIPKMPKLDT